MAEQGFEPFVAVDVGNFSLKFVYAAPGADGKPVLKALSNIPIPQFTHMLTADEREKMSREDVENDALAKLRKFLTKQLTEQLYDNQIQTKRAVTLASGRMVTIRYIEIPPPEKPEEGGLTMAVNEEAAKQMPFSMENAVLGFSEEGEVKREDKTLLQIMVAALQKDIVAVMTQSLKGGGMTNEGILTLPQALGLLLKSQLSGQPGKDSRTAVVHCGHKTTSIMIYKNGVLNFYRDINMAGETITEAIFVGGEIEGEKIAFSKIDEAVELKHKIGVLPPDEIKALKGPERWAGQQIFATVEKIFQHIQLSVSFYISQFGEGNLDKIVLTGGTSAMKNFKEFISESLEVPVVVADPYQVLPLGEVNFPQDRSAAEAAALAPAMGVALYAGQPGIINFIDILFPNRKTQSLDFSKVSSKFTQGLSSKFGIKLELDEKKIKILAVLLLLLILTVASYPFIQIRQEVTKAKADQKKMAAELEVLNSTNSEVIQFTSDKESLGKQGGFFDEIVKYRFENSAMLLDLASITPKQIFIVRAQFSNVEGKRTIKIECHTDTSDRVFEYIKCFEKSEYFKTPSLESTEEVPIDEKRYFIRFLMNGVVQAPTPNPVAGETGEPGEVAPPGP